MPAESIKEWKILNKKGREKGDGRVKVWLKREECGSRGESREQRGVQRVRWKREGEARGWLTS